MRRREGILPTRERVRGLLLIREGWRGHTIDQKEQKRVYHQPGRRGEGIGGEGLLLTRKCEREGLLLTKERRRV